MPVQTPACLGLILLKNERTRAYIEQRIAIELKIRSDAREHLEEDEHLIAFTIAMNGRDLEAAIGELESRGARCGIDFVATASPDGVLGDVPAWLRETSIRVGPYLELTKIYSIASMQDATAPTDK